MDKLTGAYPISTPLNYTRSFHKLARISANRAAVEVYCQPNHNATANNSIRKIAVWSAFGHETPSNGTLTVSATSLWWGMGEITAPLRGVR